MTRDELNAMIQGCPFHRLLGLTLEDFDTDAGRVSISMVAQKVLSRDDQKVELHGGVIATLIDLTGDYAVALKVGHGVPTVGISVDYLRLARGKKLIATAEIVKCGRSIAVVDIRAHDETGQLIAVGRGTYSSVVRDAA